MNPKVSIILPNYNHQKYLSRRIESLLEQTYCDFELIILDDCSTDQSRELIKKYAQLDKRISLEFNEKNSGSTFRQWNKGVQLAQGEYIWIAESDDWADKLFLEKLIEAVGKHKNIGIAYAQSYEVDEEDNIIGSRLEWTNDLENKDKWLKSYINSGHKEINENLCLKNTIPNVSATLIKRDAYVSVGQANNQMKYAGDWELYSRILINFDIAYVADHLNYNRRHNQTQRVKKTFTKLAVSEILEVLRVMSPVLLENKKQKAYQILSARWASSLYHDASTYSIKEIFAYYRAFRSSLGQKNTHIFPLMLRRVLPF